MKFMMRSGWALLATLLLTNVSYAQKPGEQTQNDFSVKITRTVPSRYLLYLPKDYDKRSKERWPLILFLHGSGERGDDLDKVKTHGPPKLIAQGQEMPFIVVSPQCPERGRWEPEVLSALLDSVTKKYKVDKDRIYLTGLSMGGFGTWALATAEPDRFAAIAPICGGGNPQLASRLKDVPTWVFHGGKDPTVPIKESEDMVAALKAAGGDVKFTVYPEAGHDSWTQAYNDPELYKWFLSHRRHKAEK
jgi:predicted peptidase